MKVLYFDTETTGLDGGHYDFNTDSWVPGKNDIIQFAGIVEIDGNPEEEFSFNCQPFDYRTIQKQAIETHGISIEEMKKFMPPLEMRKKLIEIFSKYIDKYNRDDKFIPAGQNVKFDLDFLHSHFQKCGDKYCGSWVMRHTLDLWALSTALATKGFIDVPNFKLETIAEFFGVPLEAHDALNDIRATRQIIRIIMDTYMVKP